MINDDSKTYYDLGAIYKEQKKYEKAFENFDKCINLDTKFKDAIA